MKKLILITLVVAAFAAFKCNNIRHITGAVYGSDDKLPIPGAVIKIDGSTASGTLTNVRGIYAIDVPDNNSRLVFSYKGFKSKTISLSKTDTLDVYLDPSASTNGPDNASQYQPEKRKYAENDQSNDTGRGNQLMDLAPTVNSSQKTQNGEAKQSTGYKAPAINSYRPNSLPEIYNNGNHYLVRRGPHLPHPYRPAGGSSNESYQPIYENGFSNPKDVPLSTFGVDVDPASYSNVRRFINSGKLPPPNAVRVEEMINYFKYDLTAPVNNQPVAITTEVSSAPWNPNHRLVRIGIKAREAAISQLPPSNLVFLLDISGSMASANKLPLVKVAMKMLIGRLRPVDRVAIVTYAGHVGVQLESTPCSERDMIINVIDRLRAGGSTAGAEGIKTAYTIARENYVNGGIIEDGTCHSKQNDHIAALTCV